MATSLGARSYDTSDSSKSLVSSRDRHTKSVAWRIHLPSQSARCHESRFRLLCFQSKPLDGGSCLWALVSCSLCSCTATSIRRRQPFCDGSRHVCRRPSGPKCFFDASQCLDLRRWSSCAIRTVLLPLGCSWSQARGS